MKHMLFISIYLAADKSIDWILGTTVFFWPILLATRSVADRLPFPFHNHQYNADTFSTLNTKKQSTMFGFILATKFFYYNYSFPLFLLWRRITFYVNSISIYNRVERDYVILTNSIPFARQHLPSAITGTMIARENTVKQGRRLMWWRYSGMYLWSAIFQTVSRSQFRPIEKNTIALRIEKGER